jgi:hypothetical protein
VRRLKILSMTVFVSTFGKRSLDGVRSADRWVCVCLQSVALNYAGRVQVVSVI